MKKSLCSIIILITTINIFANDSFSWNNAETGLVVLDQNDDILIRKESLAYDSDTKEYEIRYIFENTANENIKVQSAFPVSSELPFNLDYLNNDLITNMKSYYKFQCFIDGQEEKRELKELDKIYYENANYAFVNEVEFKPRQKREIKIIYHDEGTTSINYDIFHEDKTGLKILIFKDLRNYRYILKTGNNWKGNIEEFELDFNIPDFSKYNIINKNEILELSEERIKKTNIISNYKLDEIKYEVNEYSLKLNKNNFKPEKNLEIITESIYSENINVGIIAGLIKYYLDDSYYVKSEIDYIFNNIKKFVNITELEYLLRLNVFDQISQETESIETGKLQETSYLIRFLINSLYARYGYDFTNNKWKDIFYNFDWYSPKGKNIKLSEDDEKYLEKLKNARFIITEEIKSRGSNKDYAFTKLSRDIGK